MNPNAPAAPSEPQGGLAYKWRVLISVVFGIFMIILDSTVVNVAFQTLRSEYKATLSDAQWVLSVYVLALGITTPLSGYLADRFGIKRVYVGGLAIFVIGSLLCGLAPTLPFLIAARALQGFGGGLAQPLGPALLYRTFPPQEQGTALGYFGIALVLAPALGPILGGILVDANVWRWIFFINIPIGLLGVFLASRWLRAEPPTRKPLLDPIGLVTAVIGFGAVLYGASNAAEKGWTDQTVLVSFAIGVIGLVIFTLNELFVAKEPLMDLRLFRGRNFLVGSLVGYVAVLALFGAEFLMPVYLQALRGRTALETGFILLGLAVAAGIATPLAGRLYDKIGPRPIVVTGFAILVINTWQLSQIQALTPIWYIVFLLALRGLAVGLTIQTTFTTILASVPRNMLPRGSSLANSTRFVIQSIGVAILATVLSSSVSTDVRAQAQTFQEQGSTSTRFGLCETPGVATDDNIPPAAADAINKLPTTAAAPAKAEIRKNIQRACDENLVAFETTYRITFFAALVAMLIGFFLPGWPLAWGGRASLQGSAPPTAGH
ncbi:MAG: DHA2 family efflux MFS transporter permease subunit [Roseiflexaceae bacterium]|nr:DHA2 family efflux MFS transporter permease subunit [Roseiflexaceae bacterium]